MVTSLTSPACTLLQELREGKCVFLFPLAGLDYRDEQYRHRDQYHPEDDCLYVRIHETSLLGPHTLRRAIRASRFLLCLRRRNFPNPEY